MQNLQKMDIRCILTLHDPRPPAVSTQKTPSPMFPKIALHSPFEITGRLQTLKREEMTENKKNLLQFWRNASRGITGLPPACYAHLVENKLVQDFLIYKVKHSELVADGSELLLSGSDLPIWSFSPCRLGPQLLQGLEDKLKSKKNRYLLWICKKKHVNSEVGKCKTAGV